MDCTEVVTSLADVEVGQVAGGAPVREFLWHPRQATIRGVTVNGHDGDPGGSSKSLLEWDRVQLADFDPAVAAVACVADHTTLLHRLSFYLGTCLTSVMPRRSWPAEWQRGLLPAVVLGMLNQRPQHGYAIAQELERCGWGTIRGGTLYPIFRNLEAQQLIAGTWEAQDRGPARKYYHLTTDGVRAAAEHRIAWDRLSQSMSGLLGREESHDA